MGGMEPLNTATLLGLFLFNAAWELVLFFLSLFFLTGAAGCRGMWGVTRGVTRGVMRGRYDAGLPVRVSTEPTRRLKERQHTRG
jgi:uncharacterized protein (DUF58 family)